MQLSASASLQPVVDLSLVPLTDNPEVAFDLIAASNLQTEVTPEPLNNREATEAEEPEEAADLQPDASDELKEKEEPVEDSEEEIPLEEVLDHCNFFLSILGHPFFISDFIWFGLVF